jgi:hypothetical protein
MTQDHRAGPANTTAQKLIEDKHNERLDTISAKQKKILQYTATMEGIKELYHLDDDQCPRLR